MSQRTVETPFGEIEVMRRQYRAVGVAAIAPLDAALGLPEEKYTHEVRRIAAEESAKSSFDEVVELFDNNERELVDAVRCMRLALPRR